MVSMHFAPMLLQLALPMLVLGLLVAALYMFLWSGLRLRSCRWLKKLLRLTGVDKFDDFDVTILVHEAKFPVSNGHTCSYVRIVADKTSAQTDFSTKGVFQQPLSLFIPQGTKHVAVELLDDKARVFASLKLDAERDILETPMPPQEVEFAMSVHKAVGNAPKLRLTMAVDTGADVETGLLNGMSLETSFLVRQQIRKSIDARKSSLITHGVPQRFNNTDLDILRDACAGPLELFEGLRNTGSVYIAVQTPPLSKTFMLAMWDNQTAYEEQVPPSKSIDLLRVRSVQPDPARANVFMINYYDKDRTIKKLTLKRTDRARDVWVETLRLLLQQVHAEKRQSSWGDSRDRERPSQVN